MVSRSGFSLVVLVLRGEIEFCWEGFKLSQVPSGFFSGIAVALLWGWLEAACANAVELFSVKQAVAINATAPIFNVRIRSDIQKESITCSVRSLLRYQKNPIVDHS